MMSLSYVKKYFIVCYLVLFLVINAVAEISLDYYFGNDEPLRSVGKVFVSDCGTAAMRNNCFQECGLHHACLLGQCFCVKVRASPKKDEDLTEEKRREDSSVDESSVEESSVEELSVEKSSVEEPSVKDITGEEFFDKDEEDALEFTSNEESNNINEELVERPALRHHIAHFCPNLDKARQCIKKCMKLGLPAFCGKDHSCYCGHKYENSGKDPKIDPSIVHNQFKDLYEKYFGPKSSKKTQLMAMKYNQY